MSGSKRPHSWWQRRAIRRAAIVDARHRMPLPSLEGVGHHALPGDALWMRRDEQIVAAHAELVELVTQRRGAGCHRFAGHRDA